MGLNFFQKANYTVISWMLPRRHRWLQNAHAVWARKERGARCWISGKRNNLESHHAFSYRSWFLFRYADFNKVYLHRDIHAAYHKWMGGTWVMTTPFSLWRFKVLYKAGKTKGGRLGFFSMFLIFFIFFFLLVIYFLYAYE